MPPARRVPSRTPLVAAPPAPSEPVPIVSKAPPATPAHGSRASASPFESLLKNYLSETPDKLKLLDGFQFFLMLTGVIQFVYFLLVTRFPFNAFVGGFAATVGQFVLTASLRSQVNPKNTAVFPDISPERAFADFLFGSLILHFFVFNYLG